MPEIDELIRSNRKTLSIQIDEDARLIVRAPFFMSKKRIDAFLETKLDWIETKQSLMQQRKQTAEETGDYLFLGQVLTVIKWHGKSIKKEGNLLFVPECDVDTTQAKIIAWYRKEARHILGERLDICSVATGIAYTSMSITGARTRWGSCSAKGSINLTWRLVMAPLEVIDYIMVHELTHILHHNHSKAYWNKVQQFRPNYKQQEHWLKEHQKILKVL